MLDFKPQIVHFSGHGAGQEGLVFEDTTGQEKLVSSKALADLFKLFSDHVECVVLNACYSTFQAEAIAQHIDYVIGMNRAIGDKAAIEFSIGFYTALGAGKSIEFAYNLGCNAIHLEGFSDHLTPVLHSKESRSTDKKDLRDSAIPVPSSVLKIPSQKDFRFTEDNIQNLFGHEAAEDEDQDRLRQYYFKGNVYNQIVADLPLRLLVGHKGIGKSALLKVAIAEALESGIFSILIQPNDITDLQIDSADFLLTIRNWTEGLRKIIARKVLACIGVRHASGLPKIEDYGGDTLEYITDCLRKVVESNSALSKDKFVENFFIHKKLSVYIDDLDRGWQGKKTDIHRISALLNAVRDISSQNNRGITFKIALRSDVYYLVRTSDESTDKIEGSVIWHTWTNHEIFVLLIKRIETFFGRPIDEGQLLKSRQQDLATYLSSVMEQKFTGNGHWANAPMYRILMSLIRKRPRDLIKLCTLAARKAETRNSSIIRTVDFEAIFEEYSQGRIQDTINEFRSELPDIEQLLVNMKPNRKERTAKAGYVYQTANLLKKIDNIPKPSGGFRFATGRIADRQDLAAFLYKINFLTARKEAISGGIVRKYFEENRYLNSKFADFGFDWEIHPAYRWALQPDSIDDIFKTLELNADDQ